MISVIKKKIVSERYTFWFLQNILGHVKDHLLQYFLPSFLQFLHRETCLKCEVQFMNKYIVKDPTHFLTFCLTDQFVVNCMLKQELDKLLFYGGVCYFSILTRLEISVWVKKLSKIVKICSWQGKAIYLCTKLYSGLWKALHSYLQFW